MNNNNFKRWAWIIGALLTALYSMLGGIAKMNYDRVTVLHDQITRVEEEQKRRGAFVGKIESIERRLERLEGRILERDRSE